ncbi:MAG: aminotransferase class V-fold PLP-dependent enzyme, partial [Oscillospiraceae bacterium]|nr:aminotransferase class V-fold PLP-dependent enzyme [Oscillospiraceae bacterium]
TSGATESNNTAILSVAEKYPRNGKRIVTTAIEHPSAAKAADILEARGYEVVRLAPKDHEDFEGAFADAVDDNTALVSCMAVNNETGYAVDAARLYRLVKRANPNTIVHIDAVQGFLKMPLEGDLISVSGHKIHAFKGIGALYVKKGVRVAPLLVGGGQQKNLRSGTEAVELIAGFEAAVKAYRGSAERFAELRARLLDNLSGISGIHINSNERCVPNIINFSVSGVRSEIMLHALEEKEIYVSSGSACSRGKKSGVLAAFGVSDKDSDSALRVSLCADTSESDIDFLCENIRANIERFRR